MSRLLRVVLNLFTAALAAILVVDVIRILFRGSLSQIEPNVLLLAVVWIVGGLGLVLGWMYSLDRAPEGAILEDD